MEIFIKLEWKLNKNLSKAIEFYRKASFFDELFVIDSLGTLYPNGNGVEQDYKMAIQYYEQSIKFCCAISMNNLGILYANGNGVQKKIIQ